MRNEARHHHYIPQCYLRGFAVGTGKKCRVTVANLQSQQFFDTNPRNVGGIRDFNRVELDGFRPDALEGMLSKFEGEVATAIRNVGQSPKFEGDDKIAILNLVALLAVRSPQQRENWRQFEEQVLKQVLGLSLATRERWESQVKQMKQAGYTIDESTTYEQMKEFYDRDEYDIRLNSEHHIALEFKAHDTVLRTLVARKWMLYTATAENGYFVTTDRPVLLNWNDPETVPALYRQSPGFGMPETELLVPLTKEMLLQSSFEGREATEAASTTLVAVANTKMIQQSFGQVYCAKRAFPYIGPGRLYYNDRHFMERFQQYKQASDA